MQTEIAADVIATEPGRRADEILRSCVHCGFCNATCPTYQVRGDERDGPRGRIYLIKDLLESDADGAVARTHLDRCLTCRACETTCPSGVRFGELAEIGREMLEERQPRRSLLLRLLLAVVPRPALLRVLLTLGRPLRALLPRRHRRLFKPPPRVAASVGDGGIEQPAVLLLKGCVQRAVTPEVNAHLANLLRARGLTPSFASDERCCGSLTLHYGGAAQGRSMMRRNVRALKQRGGLVVSTASGCGVTLKEYGRLLGGEDALALSSRVRDAAEVLSEFDFGKRPQPQGAVHTVAWHPPCTLQHGQRITGLVENILTRAGYELVPVADAHLCCGSAGAYSLLQPELATELKRRKAEALVRHAPDVVATANIGCQTHLADAVGRPVVHWVELIE